MLDHPTLLGQVWRPISRAPGYFVSDHGAIRRRLKRGSWKYLLGCLESRGYRQVRLIRRLTLVHRLVAEAFLGPCPVGHEVDHRDGVRDHNWASNLDYVTRAENMRRGWRRGTVRMPNRWRHGSGHQSSR
jgi:hypothetical protein